jgi:hypothetical protein
MWSALNLAGHLTSLSGPARAQNPLLPIGVTSLTRNHGGGLGVLSWMRLRSSMTLWRSSRLRPCSRALQFCVMRRRASCSDRCRFGLAKDVASIQARLARLLWPADGSPQGMLADLLSQKCKGRTIGCYTMDGPHDRLYLNGIKVQI